MTYLENKFSEYCIKERKEGREPIGIDDWMKKYPTDNKKIEIYERMVNAIEWQIYQEKYSPQLIEDIKNIIQNYKELL